MTTFLSAPVHLLNIEICQLYVNMRLQLFLEIILL